MTTTPELDALVGYSFADGVAVLRMDDGKANAISHEMANALEQRLLGADQARPGGDGGFAGFAGHGRSLPLFSCTCNFMRAGLFCI